MGQSKNPRREKDNEAKAFAKYVRTSPQKLNLLAKTIRGKSASRALIDLEFSKRRAAEDGAQIAAICCCQLQKTITGWMLTV